MAYVNAAAQLMLLFLVLVVNSTWFQFYSQATHSYALLMSILHFVMANWKLQKLQEYILKTEHLVTWLTKMAYVNAAVQLMLSFVVLFLILQSSHPFLCTLDEYTALCNG